MVINPNFLDLGGKGFHESLVFVFPNPVDVFVVQRHGMTSPTG
jgi:hypothetical protein